MVKYWAFVLSLWTLCCGTTIRYEPPRTSAAALVREASSASVALILRDEDGDVRAFCSGVWVGRGLILTAAHCPMHLVPEGSTAIGTRVLYIVESEVTGYYKEPRSFHVATLMKIDEKHDLALLAAPWAPPHHIAELAMRAPEPGDSIHCVGQAQGYYWTYMRGAMSRVWELMPAGKASDGPWMQITAPVSHGMSGSGAWDDTGRLVGVLSGMAERTPNVAFYVHTETVRTFIGG